MTHRVPLKAAAFAWTTALTLIPSSSGAQTAATSFDGLRGVVQDGDELRVTGPDGSRTQGKLVTVTPSSVDIAVEKCRFLILCKSTQQSLPGKSVTTITRIDSPREGVLIGSASAFMASTLIVCNNSYFSEPGSGCAVAVVLVAVPLGLLGGSIGGLLDWRRNRTVYRALTPAASGATVSIAPLVTSRGTGALLSVRF